MWVETQDGNNGLGDPKIDLEGFDQDIQFRPDDFTGDGWRDLIQWHMTGYHGYLQGIGDHHHQTFLDSKFMGQVFGVAWILKPGHLHGVLIDWCGDQQVDMAFFEVSDGPVEGDMGYFTAFLCLFTQRDIDIILPYIDHIDLLGIDFISSGGGMEGEVTRVDDVLVVTDHLAGAVDHRCAQLCH